MPSFRIIPSDDPGAFIDFDGTDASSSLHVASARRIGEADIYQDGEYLFSLRQNGAGSCWVIQTKAELTAPLLPREEIASLG
jgi:hypothetical protein